MATTNDTITTNINVSGLINDYSNTYRWYDRYKLSYDYKPLCPCPSCRKTSIYETYFPLTTTGTMEINMIDSEGVYEMDLPGADNLKVTTSRTKMTITAEVKGKDYSKVVSIPERFQGSTPTGSYLKGVLRVEFEPAEENEVELTFD